MRFILSSPAPILSSLLACTAMLCVSCSDSGGDDPGAGAAGSSAGGSAGASAAGGSGGGAAGGGGLAGSGATGGSSGGSGGGGTGGTGAYPAWPTFGGVSPGTKPVCATLPAPGYLSWVLDPRTTPPHITDGRIPTEVARVTDAAAFGLPSSATFRVQYSKVSPWNADGSLAVVFYQAGGPLRAALLDGKTFKFLRLVDDLWPTGRWSLTRPNVWIQPDGHQAPRFDEVDVQTGQTKVFKDFTPDGFVDRADGNLFGAEGNQSNDDRIWAFNLKRTDGTWELVIWDSVQDKILGRIETPGEQGSGKVIDWWTVSQSGKFVVTGNQGAWSSGGTSVPEGNNVWSLDGKLLRTSAGSLGHQDVCLDAAGNDVLGFIGSKHKSNDKIAQTWRLDGSGSGQTQDQMQDGYIGWTYHINCRNTSRPGYMVVASSLATPVSNYNGFPLWNHIFALKFDGSGQPGIVANAHHSKGGETVNAYNRAPFGPSNRDLTAVMFQAEWDGATGGPVHLYVARPRP